MREHVPILLDVFNGLYDRGDVEETPLDAFSECLNIKFVGEKSFGTRDGIGRHQNVASPISNILRIYNYPTVDKNTLLVLTKDGKIYHIVDSTTIYGPILTISSMIDFGFVPYAGRAYITPFFTETVGELARERGIQSEFLYVYKGDGTSARKAAGSTPSGTLVCANGAAGYTEAGDHVFAVVGETDTGYLSAPCAKVKFTTGAANSVSFSSIPLFTGSQWTKRHIVATKVIQSYTGNVSGYQFLFIPGALINNNTATTLANISFYDADLLLDASHLNYNFDSIPAGVGLTVYRGRLIIYCTYTDISLAYASSVGEPEAISMIDSVLLVPPDGNPLTNAAELRDVLYLFKRNKTVAFIDNGDIPASWPMTVIDNAMGCGVHGIATVLDAGSSNIDYLIVGSFKGITLFNGRYILPELSWKIQNFWTQQDFKSGFRRIQMVNDSLKQELYCVTTDRNVLMGNYANGMDPKRIRWSPWSFDTKVNSLALINVNDLILGCDQV